MPVALDAGLGRASTGDPMLGGAPAGCARESAFALMAFSGASTQCGALRSRSMDPNAHPGRYRVSLHRARGTWFVSVLDLPGCIGRGATEVEAVENARAVIRSYHQLARLLALDPARIILEINA